MAEESAQRASLPGGSRDEAQRPRRHARGHGLRRRLLGRVLVVSTGFAVIGALATVPQVSTWVGDRLLESSTVNITDSCDAVNVTQPHGVGRPGARDKVAEGQRQVTDFNPNRKIYRQHVALDTDRDGIACERH